MMLQLSSAPLISAKLTLPFFSRQKKRDYYLGNYKIISQKYCGGKMLEPKNKMQSIMDPPPYVVKC